MSEVQIIEKEISIARRELKNLRQEVMKLKAQIKSEIVEIKTLLSVNHIQKAQIETTKKPNEMCFPMVPIGVVSSCFKHKNGIPRQPSLCQSAKATLEINKTYFTNPEHSLIGLDEFSYIWLLFVFHKNDSDNSVKAKVHPPRLNGASVGVFSTRSPHRPCAIGLSLTKLDQVLGNKLYLSGVDLLDGTPILDIKPYIPSYDTPQIYESVTNTKNNLIFPVVNMENIKDSTTPGKRMNECKHVTADPNSTPECIFSDINQDKCKEITLDQVSHKDLEASNKIPSTTFKDVDSNASKNFSNNSQNVFPSNSVVNLLNEPLTHLAVVFTPRAENNIEEFHSTNHTPRCEYCLDYIDGFLEAKKAITEVLQNDPRSVYRKKKCSDKLYFFEIDRMHVTCWFEDKIVEILRVKPACEIRTNCD